MKFSTTTTTTSGGSLPRSRGFFMRVLIVCVLAFATSSTAVLGQASGEFVIVLEEEPTPTPKRKKSDPSTEPSPAPMETPTPTPTLIELPLPTEVPSTLPNFPKSGSGSGESLPFPETTSEPPTIKPTIAPNPTPTPTPTAKVANDTINKDTSNGNTSNRTPAIPKETSSPPGATTDSQDSSNRGSSNKTVVLFVVGGVIAVCATGLIMMLVLRSHSNHDEDDLQTPLPYQSDTFKTEPRGGYPVYSNNLSKPLQGHHLQDATSPNIPRGSIDVRNSAKLLGNRSRSSSLTRRLSSSSFLLTGSDLHRFRPSNSTQFTLRGASEASETTSTMTYLDRSSNFSVDSRLSFESTFTHNTGARGTNRENSFSTTSSLTDHDAFDFDTNSVSFINTQSTDDVPNLPITAEDRQSYEL